MPEESPTGGAKTIGLIGSLAVLLNNILGSWPQRGCQSQDFAELTWSVQAGNRELFRPLPAEWLVAPHFPRALLRGLQHLQRSDWDARSRAQ